jgi:hypothetical protein
MQSGTLTVTGKNSTYIPLDGHPRQAIVCFINDEHHVPCNPHHHDHLRHHLTHEDEDTRGHHDHEHEHHHHDRKFTLVIEWEVFGVREIEWIVFE